MVPNINNRGQSFKGVTAYLMHDKKAKTSDRVAWTSTHNVHTNDVEKASRFMAWTDLNRDILRAENEGSAAGRKADAGNVYHYSLAWSPDEAPTRENMEAAAHDSVQRLGLDAHQYYLVSHTDTDHAHVHVVANLTHPETGLIHNVYRDRKVLDRWANEYEQEHGIKCTDRDKKYQAWDDKQPAFTEKSRRAEYQKIATAAYRGSDSGAAFKAALDSEDLTIAQGKRRALVVVDRRGEVYALNRLIDSGDGLTGRARTKAITAKLDGIDKSALPMADQLADERAHFDRDAQERQQQDALDKAAEKAAEERLAAERQETTEKPTKPTTENPAPSPGRSERWQNPKHAAYEKKKADRIEHWRNYWQLPRLEAERKAAEDHLRAHSGWLFRYVLRSKYRDAVDAAEAARKSLDHAREIWRGDIEAIHANRPQWVIDRELRDRGFDVPRPTPDRTQDVERLAVDADKQASPRQKAEVSRLRSRVATQTAKREAASQEKRQAHISQDQARIEKQKQQANDNRVLRDQAEQQRQAAETRQAFEKSAAEPEYRNVEDMMNQAKERASAEKSVDVDRQEISRDDKEGHER